jgi:hypothetical protein
LSQIKVTNLEKMVDEERNNIHVGLYEVNYEISSEIQSPRKKRMGRGKEKMERSAGHLTGSSA